jgi:hypothetical protein
LIAIFRNSAKIKKMTGWDLKLNPDPSSLCAGVALRTLMDATLLWG